MHSCEITENDRSKLLLFLMRKGASRPDAEDIVQLVILKAWNKRHQYRGDSKWLTWLHAIARNEYRMSVRRFRPVVLPLSDATDLQSSAAIVYEEINLKDRMRALQTKLAKLPRDDRAILDAVYFQDKTVKQAAAALGLTAAAAKTRCWRAVNRLRAMYGSGFSEIQGRSNRCNSYPY